MRHLLRFVGSGSPSNLQFNGGKKTGNKTGILRGK